MAKRTIKALCLQDYGTPETNYGTLIEQGIKTIETRVWPTNFRGDLLITVSNSAKSPNKGLAVCVVEVVGCEKMTKEHEKAACCEVYVSKKGKPAMAWHLKNLRPLSHKFPVKSQLSIFNVELPDDVTF